MIINILIGICFLAYIVLKGTRKAFPLFFTVCIFGWQFQIAGPLTLEDILLLEFFIFGFRKIKKTLLSNTYPYVIVSFLSIVSYFLSALHTTNDPHWALTFLICWRSLGLPILLFSFVENITEMKRFFRILYVVILITFFSCIVDLIIGDHLWLSLIRAYIDPGYGFDMGTSLRYGINRIQGFFPQPISLGYFSVTVFSFMLFFQESLKKYLSPKAIKLSLFILIICSFLSTSRVAIVALALSILLFSRKKILNPKYWFSLVFLTCIAIFCFGDYINTIIQSIVQSENTEGSSTELRTGQLEVCLTYFAQSPIVGLGTYAIFDVARKYNSIILGAESIWFFLMVNNGILGCFSYICFYIKSMRFLPYWKWECFSILIVQLFFNTFTSIPGFDVGFMLCIMLLINRLYLIQSSQNALRQ